jgi:hypothetical protein
MSIVISYSSPTAVSTVASSILSTTTFPLHHAVTIKLNKNNLLWRAQLLPYLRSSKLIGYLDGTLIAPASQIMASTQTDTELVPN